MNKVLEVINISKTYKEFRLSGKGQTVNAVKNVSFDVYAGEILGFLGPNGAGKSTAIKIITSLAAPTSGEVLINGYSVTNEKEKAMENVGGVIESPDMYLEMSGETNLRYFAAIAKMKDVEKRIDEVLRLVGLYDRRKDLVRKYSLGMKQRLGIAQAILRNPSLLILDEPANGLDPSGIREIRDMLKKFAKEGMAILVSSHQLAEMELMCDRVIIINKGEIVGENKIDDLNNSCKEGNCIIISTDNKILAVELLKSELDIDATFEGEDIIIKTDIQASELTKVLVLGGVNVSGVKHKEVSLEDTFFKLTKGGQ